MEMIRATKNKTHFCSFSFAPNGNRTGRKFSPTAYLLIMVNFNLLVAEQLEFKMALCIAESVSDTVAAFERLDFHRQLPYLVVDSLPRPKSLLDV
jgi:hypothetical protein